MQFIKLTNKDQKQWLLPLANLRTGLAIYQPSAWKGKMLKRLLPWLAHFVSFRKHTGLGKRIGLEMSEADTLPIPPSVQAKLQQVFDNQDLTYSVFLGTPSVHQKEVIQISTGNTLLGYAKLSPQPQLYKLFQHEVEILEYLHRIGLKGSETPLFCDEIEKQYIFTQTTHKTLRSPILCVWGHWHEQYIEQLQKATEQTLPYEQTEYYHDLQQLLAELDSLPQDWQLLIRTHAEEVKQASLPCIKCCVAHGDFTPWNTYLTDNQLYAFDWEYAHRTYPLGIDKCHFLVQTALLVQHEKPERILKHIRKQNITTLQLQQYLLSQIALYHHREPKNTQILQPYMEMLEKIEKTKGQKDIACFHLLNDYSGSPKILKTTIQIMLQEGHHVTLYTSRGGVLDELAHPHLRIRHIPYHFHRIRFFTLVIYIYAQFCMFFAALFCEAKADVFWVNTILPVAPALAGKIRRKRIVYHCHEFVTNRGRAYRFLAQCMHQFADTIICVSQYQTRALTKLDNVHIIPNSIDDNLLHKLVPHPQNAFEHPVILMPTSLKVYKGIAEFVQLATLLPQYTFQLVINDTEGNIRQFWEEQQLPTNLANLRIEPRTEAIWEFYNISALTLNLSHKDTFVETFGLTVVEGMSAGLPCIVPTVGGIYDTVQDGVNGYHLDACQLHEIVDKIQYILRDYATYLNFSQAALQKAKQYQSHSYKTQIISLLRQ